MRTKPVGPAIIALAALLAAASVSAQPAPALQGIKQQAQRSTQRAQEVAEARAQRGDFDHGPLDRVLSEHVQPGGWVDYAAIARAPADLDHYLTALSETDLEGLSPRGRLATLINAYNAFTLRLILDHWDAFEAGEVKSITELADGKPWDQKRWRLGGRTVSLNELEHGIIREDFAEPRIHWALVCAAYSCPPLRAQAYTAERLEDQLAEQERLVLNPQSPRFMRVERRGGRARAWVTRLFEWYGEDFSRWTEHPDWQSYVRSRVPVADLRFEGFLDYDWRLNSVANRPQRDRGANAPGID